MRLDNVYLWYLGDSEPRYVGALHLVAAGKQLQCGLNGCNHWHQHGFIIATKSGDERRR